MLFIYILFCLYFKSLKMESNATLKRGTGKRRRRNTKREGKPGEISSEIKETQMYEIDTKECYIVYNLIVIVLEKEKKKKKASDNVC